MKKGHISSARLTLTRRGMSGKCRSFTCGGSKILNRCAPWKFSRTLGESGGEAAIRTVDPSLIILCRRARVCTGGSSSRQASCH